MNNEKEGKPDDLLGRIVVAELKVYNRGKISIAK